MCSILSLTSCSLSNSFCLMIPIFCFCSANSFVCLSSPCSIFFKFSLKLIKTDSCYVFAMCFYSWICILRVWILKLRRSTRSYILNPCRSSMLLLITSETRSRIFLRSSDQTFRAFSSCTILCSYYLSNYWSFSAVYCGCILTLNMLEMLLITLYMGDSSC